MRPTVNGRKILPNIWTAEGWLYLAVILDLHCRRVVGWAVNDRMKKCLAIAVLEMAVRLRPPPEVVPFSF